MDVRKKSSISFTATLKLSGIHVKPKESEGARYSIGEMLLLVAFKMHCTAINHFDARFGLL